MAETYIIIFKALLAIAVFVITNSSPTDSVGKTDSGWLGLHEQFLNETKTQASKIQAVFFGDSVTQGWAWNGGLVWGNYYGATVDAGVHAVNYGISGDKTENLIWRINNGEFTGLSPKLIVVLIGTNNLESETVDANIAKGVTAVVDGLHSNTAKAKILLLGILPRGDNADYNTRIKAINTQISALNGRNSVVSYLDMWNQFYSASSSSHVNETLYDSSKLHLTQQGYEMWAKTMDTLFKKLYSS